MHKKYETLLFFTHADTHVQVTANKQEGLGMEGDEAEENNKYTLT